jgi:GNAT superfamily N-acetyltransferase
MPPVEAIRDAREAEAGGLEALQLRASTVYESHRDQVLAHPEVVELPPGAVADGRVRVAEVDGRILGFSVVLPVADGGCELDGLFVEPAHWHAGIGRALVDDAAAWARAHGAQRVDVIANPNALGFYDKVGFRITGEVPTRFGPGLRMTLGLDAA